MERTFQRMIDRAADDVKDEIVSLEKRINDRDDLKTESQQQQQQGYEDDPSHHAAFRRQRHQHRHREEGGETPPPHSETIPASTSL